MKARGPIREAAELGLLYAAGALVGRVLRDRSDRRKARRLAEYLARPPAFFVAASTRASSDCPYWQGEPCTCPGAYPVTPGDSTVPPRTRRFD